MAGNRFAAELKTTQKRVKALEAGDQDEPEWFDDPHFPNQGRLLFGVEYRRMLRQVSQSDDPNWFDPMEPTEHAREEATKLALAMWNANSYRDAQMLAMAEHEKWPRYCDYPPTPSTPLLTDGAGNLVVR
jgi:hypothetical protein